MPDLSGNQTALRASGHKVRTYLAVFNGAVVASGTLDSAPATGAVALTWTRTAGSSSDIKPGYRVVVESGAGALKFETSVRYSGTISDANLPIREVATAEYTLSAADVVKIYNTPVLTDKLVESSATFAPDGITYVAQNTTIAPITNSGGHWAGFVDAGQTYATVITSGGGSFTVDPDSGGAITHLWTLPAGVAFAGGSANTDASPTLQADVGYWVVSHRVTDSSNSATWTQYVLLRVYSTATPPVECVVESIDGDLDTGWGGRVRVFDNAAIADIPDRSLVCVFVDETINGATASYGNRIASRSHMKLLGYLRRDENEGDAQDDTLTFEILSPWARLQEIPGFSKALERYTSTAGWNYVQSLTTKRAIIQILRWYSNWTDFYDLAFNTYTDYDYPAFFIEKATPLAQLIELADATDARVTGDRTGALLVHTRPELVALASRAALTTTITLTDDDRVRYRFSRDHFKTVDTLECRGFTAATTSAAAVPIFSRYPGVPGRGATVTSIDRLIAASQSNLNDRCGLRGASVDGVFITTAGLYHRAVDLELTLPGAYDVFDPAYQEWVAFTGAAGNRRALDLSVYRFTLRGVSVTYNGGTATTTLRLVSETAAPAGRTYVPPATSGANPNPIDFPPIEFPDTPDFNLGAGTARIALICKNGLARTTNFGSGAATTWDYQAWSAFSPAENTSLVGDGAYTAVPDGFSYNSGAVKAWVLLAKPATKIYYLDITNRTWTLKHTVGGSYSIVLNGLDSFNGGADASFGVPNHFVATVYTKSVGTRAIYTTDNSTFTEVDITSTTNTAINTVVKSPSVFVSPRTAGKVITSIHKTVSGLDIVAAVSTDYGATWADGATLADWGGGNVTAQARSLHVPYDGARNPNETIWFYGTEYVSSSSPYLVRYNNGSTSAIFTSYCQIEATRNGISTFTGNANRLLFCGADGIAGGGTYTARLTDNALAASPSWTVLTTPEQYMHCAIAGDSGSAFYFWGGQFGTNPAVGYSADGGVTVISQTGDLGTYSSGPVQMLVGW
jgi:hypothetical protein